MANPFSNLNIQRPSYKKSPSHLPKTGILDMLKQTQVSTPKGARDYVILLLRHKYCLRPCEIAALNIEHVDLQAAMIELLIRKKNPHIYLCEEDLIYFRRWVTVRRLYASSNPAFIISLHWTRGRSEPYQRISTRGIFQIANIYSGTDAVDVLFSCSIDYLHYFFFLFFR